jgi:hypothetical protein
MKLIKPRSHNLPVEKTAQVVTRDKFWHVITAPKKIRNTPLSAALKLSCSGSGLQD